MTTDLLSTRKELEEHLLQLTLEEERVNEELQQHFYMLLGKPPSKSTSTAPTNAWLPSSIYESASFDKDLAKVENFAPVFETILQNAKKLNSQIEECHSLSERLSSIVRQLDMKQMRAQKALAVTEDILSLKDCKFKIIAAIDEKNLSVAVKYIRKVHEISEIAARTSEDYETIVEKEQEVKELVRAEFQSAITESNTNLVMILCPLLQTLGLEAEARDNFLEFMEQKVFIAISADGTSVEGATDPSTGYAQALSSVFNSTYLIIQQYLPMVIQGLENSLGDVFFLRRLHARCEAQAGLVLKRYMKWRAVRERISALHKGDSRGVNTAELHVVLEELALLLQYCGRYSRYLKRVCQGAEQKSRQVESASSSPAQAVFVFPPSEALAFDKVVDELAAKYYLTGEQFLVRGGLVHALDTTGSIRSTSGGNPPTSLTNHLDEAFYVLQKCGLRAIASFNIQAACALLNETADLLASDLLAQLGEVLQDGVTKLSQGMQEHMSRYVRYFTVQMMGDTTTALQGQVNRSSLGGFLGGGSTSTGALVGDNVQILLHEEGYFTLEGGASNAVSSEDQEDLWGMLRAVQAFGAAEQCVTYTDRLARDLNASAVSTFADDQTVLTTGSSSEIDKLKLCKENFDRSRATFTVALRQAAERLAANAQIVIKDLLAATVFSKKHLRLDEVDEHLFEAQPILRLSLLPRALLIPLETLLLMTTAGGSDAHRDLIVTLLADALAEQLESFIQVSSFSLCGALKLEEIVRALASLFSRHSAGGHGSGGVRSRFSRLREIMQVLTVASVYEVSVTHENFAHITGAEAEGLLSLRIDRGRK